jgi:hypothetical protein
MHMTNAWKIKMLMETIGLSIRLHHAIEWIRAQMTPLDWQEDIAVRSILPDCSAELERTAVVEVATMQKR